MKVLGIDTSSLVLSLALVEDNKLLGEYTTNLNKNHSIRLMPAISMLLEELDAAPDELEGIAVAHGPGSYTGVRIGVTTAKTLAWSLDVPIIGISSLEAIAGNALHYTGAVCPLFDARRGQVYTALFKQGERKKEDGIRLLDEWLDELRREEQSVLFLGDDTGLHAQVIQEKLGDRASFAPAEWNISRASFIARMGMRAFKQGRYADVKTFAPQYLQLAEAEAKWLASQNR
jgi:tRNA threonylcarbamoyladenosine biosynthesis protein TsaB